MSNIPFHLKILWLVIIVGSGFLIFHYTTPRAPEFAEENLVGTTREPGSPQYEESITKGQTELDKQNFDAAKGHFINAVQENPDSLEAKILLGQSYLHNRQTAEAREIFWQLDENNPQVAFYRGLTLILYQEYEPAKAEFAKIKNERFLAAFDTASSFRESDQIFLQALLAKAMIDEGEYSAAIPLLFEIIDKQPNYRDAWIMLGYAHLKGDDAPSALHALENAYDLDPDKKETLYFLGLAHLKTGDEDQAARLIQQAKSQGYNPATP